jgi:hypothetical protein
VSLEIVEFRGFDTIDDDITAVTLHRRPDEYIETQDTLGAF